MVNVENVKKQGDVRNKKKWRTRDIYNEHEG